MSTEHYYGAIPQEAAVDAHHESVEELSTLGYTVISGALSQAELDGWGQRIDAVYAEQEREFGGREALAAIGEADLCRAPLLYDRAFVELACNEHVLPIVRRVLGDWIILNLQNAIINRPDEHHHQSAWHRDLPYQNWVISRPLAIGALFAIDAFDEATGGTLVLPHSHRQESMPSEQYIRKHALQIVAEPGSVLLFDAMVFHRAGRNRSGRVRRGVNHLYTVPILKQQYDFPRALGDAFADNAAVRQLLGYTATVPIDALQWRRERQRRLVTKMQGGGEL
jgi:ectoine hydroxylase-related dioxygenase (phytanoyl-CoA dioxygenase family)